MAYGNVSALDADLQSLLTHVITVVAKVFQVMTVERIAVAAFIQRIIEFVIVAEVMVHFSSAFLERNGAIRILLKDASMSKEE